MLSSTCARKIFWAEKNVIPRLYYFRRKSMISDQNSCACGCGLRGSDFQIVRICNSGITGPTGPTGARGATGPRGATGATEQVS